MPGPLGSTFSWNPIDVGFLHPIVLSGWCHARPSEHTSVFFRGSSTEGRRGKGREERKKFAYFFSLSVRPSVRVSQPSSRRASEKLAWQFYRPRATVGRPATTTLRARAALFLLRPSFLLFQPTTDRLHCAMYSSWPLFV